MYLDTIIVITIIITAEQRLDCSFSLVFSENSQTRVLYNSIICKKKKIIIITGN